MNLECEDVNLTRKRTKVKGHGHFSRSNIFLKAVLIKSYTITIRNFFYEAFCSLLKKYIYIFSIVFSKTDLADVGGYFPI